jgi:hypothetical protein
MASAYLNKTYSGDGDRRTFTVSVWVKCHAINSNEQSIFCAGDAANQRSELKINGSRKLTFFDYNSSFDAQLETNALLRDVNAWYHIVLKYDTTQATSSDRIKLYLNGEEQSLSTSTIPAQNHQSYINLSSKTHRINQSAAGGDIGEYTMAHFHFIDGTAYSPSDFGETDATTGIWKPKTAPSVTYGTNGFFLKFENSGAFGTDSSGNGNTFTVNGTMTQTIDTPSNVFCTLNPLVNIEGSYTLSNGNTKFTGTGTNDNCYGTLGVTQGKWYFETKWTANVATAFAGWTTMELGQTQGTGNLITKFVGQYRDDYTINFGTTGTTNTSVSANDIFGFYLDLDSATKTCKIYQNDVLIATENIPTARVGEAFTPCVGDTSATNGIIECNFGNGFFGTTAVSSGNSDANGEGIFEYNPTLSGVNYLTLNTKNINAEEYS